MRPLPTDPDEAVAEGRQRIASLTCRPALLSWGRAHAEEIGRMQDRVVSCLRQAYRLRWRELGEYRAVDEPPHTVEDDQ